MNELVSVVIPVYNVENDIERMLESVCNQTYKNLQIILVDDGSVDKSGEICDKWEIRDSRINIIHQENSGVSKARNKGIDYAVGEYLMFVDADDWIAPNMIERLLGLSEEYEADVAMCELCEITEGEELVIPKESSVKISVLEGADNAGVALLLPWSPCCKLYKRSVIGKTRFQEYKIAEDLLFNTDLICEKRICKVVKTSECFYYYLIRQSSAMKQAFQVKYMDGMYVEGMCFQRLTELSEKFADINLVGCGASLVFEKFAKLSLKEKINNRRYFKECKLYIRKMKKALLSTSNTHRKISGILKIYLPNMYLVFLSIRYKV